MADAILHNGKSELLALRRELSTHWLIRRTLHYFAAGRLFETG